MYVVEEQGITCELLFYLIFLPSIMHTANNYRPNQPTRISFVLHHPSSSVKRIFKKPSPSSRKPSSNSQTLRERKKMMLFQQARRMFRFHWKTNESNSSTIQIFHKKFYSIVWGESKRIWVSTVFIFLSSLQRCLGTKLASARGDGNDEHDVLLDLVF